jgi:hypothetical protein
MVYNNRMVMFVIEDIQQDRDRRNPACLAGIIILVAMAIIVIGIIIAEIFSK